MLGKDYKLNINKFNQILDLPVYETFTSKRSFDNRVLKFDVRMDKDGKYVYLVHSTFQVYGWTHSPKKAFNVWHEVELLNCNEIYELCRGRLTGSLLP